MSSVFTRPTLRKVILHSILNDVLKIRVLDCLGQLYRAHCDIYLMKSHQMAFKVITPDSPRQIEGWI